MIADTFLTDTIKDHYKNPRNFVKMESATHQSEESNPLCGDEIALYARVVDGVLEKVSFTGSGCSICIASASLLTEKIQNMPISEVQQLSEQDILTLTGVPENSKRKSCALLGYIALQRLMEQISEHGEVI